jgi:LmbE family N-acetylglucosaminyl deacetylase
MKKCKEALLERHRRHKRIALVVAFILLILVGVFFAWWCAALTLLFGWIAHEAWFADHIFYKPSDNYSYSFPTEARKFSVRVESGSILFSADAGFSSDTLILKVNIKSSWLGRWLDPYVVVGFDRQYFERAVDGTRYLNLSGHAQSLADGSLRVHGNFCSIESTATLYAFSNPSYAEKRLMIIAPHADDAELAAFGLYSRSQDVSIVTLTQGEIEAHTYCPLGLDQVAAARLKGRLRAWDSLAVPLWGGVPQSRCLQLGYYCRQLPVMQAQPELGVVSRESGEGDIRSVRGNNPFPLPGDSDGVSSWRNLLADLVFALEYFRPEVVVTPHPQLDPHSDHVASTQALLEAIALSSWKPKTLLLYANHLHDNDRWPMGPAGFGIALPPAIEALPADGLWSPTLDAAQQLDKAMALAMQHDLQGALPLKRRIRRLIQRLLVGRRWPVTGEDEFFRKAVRRHELFWVRTLGD